MLASFSALFSYTGISNRISKKILDFTNSKIDQHDEREYANYLIAKLTYDLCMGNFVPPDARFDSLTDRIIKGGELYSGVIMTMWSGFYFIAVGQFAKAIEMIEKLNAIHREYNQDMAGAYEITVKIRLLLKQRRLEEALRSFHEGITFVDKKAPKTPHFQMHAFKARALILSGEIEQARDCLEYLETMRSEIPLSPIFLSNYLTGRFMFALHESEKAVKTGDASYDKYAQEARSWGKKSLKVSKNFHSDRVEAMRQMGIFHWLTGKKHAALKWWRLSVETGEAFKMDLQWDLEQLENLIEHIA
jgi:tetratricopeptide (TPR) repeat protein